MLKTTLKINLEMFGLQIIAFVFSFYFLISVIPIYIYSIFTGFLFIWALHSTYWQLGNKDRKMNIIKNNNLSEGEVPHKLFLFKGALIALPHFLINVIYVFISNTYETGLPLTIQRFAMFPFIGFLDIFETDYNWGYLGANLLGCLLMYVPCTFAYMSGCKNISIIEKIVPKIIYKNPEKAKKNKG